MAKKKVRKSARGYFEFDRIEGDGGYFLKHLGLWDESAAICGVQVRQTDGKRPVRVTIFVDKNHPAIRDAEDTDIRLVKEEIRMTAIRSALHVMKPCGALNELYDTDDERGYDELLDRDIKVRFVSRE